MASKDKLIFGIVVLCFALLILAGFFPCVFRELTGFPCPSCGMTRAFQALFSGDLALAFRMHPLFWLPPVVVGLCLVRRTLFTNWYFWGVILGIFILVYVIRMYLLFPHTEPMTYYTECVFHTIFERIFLK